MTSRRRAYSGGLPIEVFNQLRSSHQADRSNSGRTSAWRCTATTDRARKVSQGMRESFRLHDMPVQGTKGSGSVGVRREISRSGLGMFEAVMNATLDKKILRNSSRIKEKQTSRGSGTLRRPYVRFGSSADIASRPRHVRYSPQSGHSSARVARPLSARTRHSRHYVAT